MEFSVNMLAIYIVTGAAAQVELFASTVWSWWFLSRISDLALFVHVRFFFGHGVALLRESYTFV